VPVAGSSTVAEATPALEVDVRGRRFRSAEGGEVHALGAVAFTLPERSFTCLTGPSGCGKTTVLRMILGLDRPIDGRVQVNGSGRVAAVFQEPRLLPWRSVEDNVRLALPSVDAGRPLGALFDTLGLAAHRALLPGELSLGLARRVALARAFALEPSLILLDEPFVSLDEDTAERLRELLLSVWRARPTTVLMVTHDLEEAVALADRVIVFSAAPGTPRASIDLAAPRGVRDGPWRVQAAARLRSERTMVGVGGLP